MKLQYPMNFPIFVKEVIFEEKNSEVINLFIKNENNKKVFICCFNKKSNYALQLEELYNIKFARIAQ